jgi:hypothetical protein
MAGLVLAPSPGNRHFYFALTVELRTESGLHTALFHVPQGQIRVNVPDEPAAGDTVFGTADQYELPLGGRAGSILSARRPFHGDPSGTNVNVGGSAALPVAESPRKVVFITPVGATKTGLIRGETAVMTAVVSGLQSLKEPA